MRMGPIGCPETSIRNYNFSLCNDPEEHNSQVVKMYHGRNWYITVLLVLTIPGCEASTIVWLSFAG